MMTYSFLVLSSLLALPGLVVWALRPDLRQMMARMMLLSLPFALTERLFYPTYWEPAFLFDLVNKIGFGIEDVLFVAGLAAFSSSAWAFASGRRLAPLGDDARPFLPTALGLLVACFAGVGLLVWLSIPMIYGAPVVMALMGTCLCLRRADLWAPGFGGMLVTTLVYTSLCLALDRLIPGVFLLDWNTEIFLNRFMLGVPLEEILYAATAGFIAAVFYPFVAGLRYVRRVEAAM